MRTFGSRGSYGAKPQGSDLAERMTELTAANPRLGMVGMITVELDRANQADRHRHYNVTGVQEGHTVQVCVRREHVSIQGGESSDRWPVPRPRRRIAEAALPADHISVDPSWWHLWLVGRDRDPDVEPSCAQAAIDAVKELL